MLFGGNPPLQNGERRVFVLRPHVWTVIAPALGVPLLMALPVPYVLIDLAVPSLRLATVFPLFLWFVVALVVAYIVKWLLFDLLPWTQRIYILTDRRLIVQSGVLSVQRRECSLRKIEESDYTSRGLAARMLDIGAVEIETMGSIGALHLIGVPHPRQVQALISDQARLLADASGHAGMNAPDDVARRLAAALTGKTMQHTAPTQVVHALTPRAVRAQQHLNLLSEETVVVTMWQHPIVLAARLAMPCFGLALVAALTVYFGAVVWPLTIAVVLGVLTPWTAWRVLAYLDHEYVLTTDRLMELRSLPLLTETRDIVSLFAVQDVMLEIPSLLGRLSDVGNVIVEVGGAAERVVVKTIGHPAELQKLIFETIEQRQQREREAEDERLVSTLSEWFTQYHSLQNGQP